MATIYKKFGEKVRKLRNRRDLSQEELSALIKRDPRTVVAIEAGKRNPTLKTIHRIVLALKVSFSELFKD